MIKAVADYPCSDLFREYHEELEGKIFPFTPFDCKPLNDINLEDSRILYTLEAMGIIQIINKPKLKGGIVL